jgi:hypothetical protein
MNFRVCQECPRHGEAQRQFVQCQLLGNHREAYQFVWFKITSLAICSWLCASGHGSSSNGKSAWHKYPEECMTSHHPPLKTGEKKEGRHFGAIGSKPWPVEASLWPRNCWRSSWMGRLHGNHWSWHQSIEASGQIGLEIAHFPGITFVDCQLWSGGRNSGYNR